MPGLVLERWHRTHLMLKHKVCILALRLLSIMAEPPAMVGILRWEDLGVPLANQCSENGDLQI